MKVQNNNHPRTTVAVLVALTTALLSFQSASGQDLNGLFADAITFAQQRMVKVYGAGAGRVNSYGTGIIVSDNGHLLTMQGVFLDGDTVRVAMPDGESFEASILRRNREYQIALLKIEAETTDYFELSDQPVGDKGDWVLALSNAFMVAESQEPMSVSLGVISLSTTIEARLNKRDFAYQGNLVLIDAITSNPGAGGGAVVTHDGKLVGMIGKVINSSKTNTRLNYAVPSSILKLFVDGDEIKPPQQIVKSEIPADLGINLFRLGGRKSPAYIDSVQRSGPAAQVGLRPDDMIVSMNGQKTTTVSDYDSVLSELAADRETVIVVKRGSSLVRVSITPVEKK